jgi:hypothetical protein
MSNEVARQLSENIAVHQMRQDEALRLYRPNPQQEEFHRATCTIRLARGGNRSGKSTCAFAEDAHAMTGNPIYGADGKPLPDKYDRNKKLKLWLFGFGEDHIGNVIYDKLFNPGAFWIIDDEITGKPRVWDPTSPKDLERQDFRRAAQPLIPSYMIDQESWSWRTKRTSSFDYVRLKNGNEIFAFTSGGNIPQGVAVDLIHADEDIDQEELVEEWVGRLPDYGGRLMWSAFPHAKNNALMTLSNLAKKESVNDNPFIVEWLMSLTANRYIPEEEKNKAKEVWGEFGAAVLAARDLGEFPMDDILMYPMYRPETHGIDPFNGHMPNCKAAHILAANNGNPPDDWMLLLSVDPGSQKACILMACMPPPEIGDEIIFFDEEFELGSSAETLTEGAFPRLRGRVWQTFIADMQAGKQTGMGTRTKVINHYEKAFADRNLESVDTGSKFKAGTTDIQNRCSLVREGLRVPRTGEAPKILFYLPRLRRTIKEFGMYRRRISNKEYQELPIAKDNDAMNCMEYIVGSEPVYVKPVRPYAQTPMSSLEAIRKMFNKSGESQKHVTLGS